MLMTIWYDAALHKLTTFHINQVKQRRNQVDKNRYSSIGPGGTP